MPFVEINVEEEIEKRRASDPGFRKAWDESKEEYERIGEKIAKRKREHNLPMTLNEYMKASPKMMVKIDKETEKNQKRIKQRY